MLAGDESCFAKQGKASVGVARQHNGRLGKTDNCQVGVFTALVRGTHSALVGCRLFVPEEWTADKPRCLKAGMPEEQIKPRQQGRRRNHRNLQPAHRDKERSPQGNFRLAKAHILFPNNI